MQFSQKYILRQTLDLTVESHINAERNAVYNHISPFIAHKNNRSAKGEPTTAHGFGGSLIKLN